MRPNAPSTPEDTSTLARGRRAVAPRAFARAGLAAAFAAGLLAAPIGQTARAQPASPEDWPCVQVFVPAISPAALWPVPIGAELAGRWREEPATAALATRLGELEALDDAELARLDEFAAAVPEDAREDALTRLADGTVAVADARRARYLDGIRRYTRQQIGIAGRIESTLNRLAELDDAPGDTSPAERAEIEETLAWDERLYDQRERALRALCERPVALEETLSEVLRELSYRLPGA